MTRVSVGRAWTGGANAAAVMAAPPQLGQLLGHVEARVAGRRAIDLGGDLPTLLQVKARRLKMQCGQYRPGTATAPAFVLRHREDPSAQTVATQAPRQEEPIYPQQAKLCTAQEAADDSTGIRIASEDVEGTPVRIS